MHGKPTPFTLPPEMSENWLDGHLPGEMMISGREQARQLTDITADAFRNDPFNKCMFRDFKAMKATFSQMIKHVFAPRGVCHMIGDEAAAMWMMPGVSRGLPARALPFISASVLWHGGPKAVKRALAFDKAVDPHHPTEPHAYLFTAGVRPSR